ncbi:MAG: YciI family protein [Acidobacteriia bacterium]|nr:YciI family protein [Terriglobia bacterium]
MARASLLLLAILGATVLLPAWAEDKAPPAPAMKLYRLVLLRKGPSRSYMDEREIQAKQEAYLAWLKRVHEQGKVVVSGPVERAGDLESVFVLDAGSGEEAAAILKDDPWVLAGRVVPEIHPWWALKDAFGRASDIARLSACWIGFLRRPPNAPQLSEEKIEEIQRGHMANIRKMAGTGDLAAAGPLDEDGPLRGILVFRTDDPEHLKALVAEDPAVKIGRLAVELYRWDVPEGAIP